MMKATQLPSGSWRVQVYLGRDAEGKKIIKSFTNPDRKRAEREAAVYSEQHKSLPTDRKSFQKAMDTYLAANKGVISPSSIRGYVSIKKMFEEKYGWFCELKCYEIEEKHIKRLLDEVSIGHSSRTIGNYRGFVSVVMKSQGYTIPEIKIKKDVKQDDWFFEDSDIADIIHSTNKSLLIPIYLAAFCGLRRSEICALRWPQDFDEKTHTAHITKAMVQDENKKWVIKVPKTPSSRRYVVIPEFVWNEIESQGKVTDKNPALITNHFSRMLKSRGLPNAHFHMLREYFASSQLSNGVPLVEVEAAGGWEHGSKALQEVYAHSLNEQREQHSQMMFTHYESILEGEKGV